MSSAKKPRPPTPPDEGAMALAPNGCYYAVLTLLDTIFSATVAAPAVVGYWRGTWGLSDAYVYPHDKRASSLASVGIGFAGLFFFSLVQHFLDDRLQPGKHRLCYYVGSRLYTAVFGVCCVNAWRGAWHALDYYTDPSASTVCATTVVSVLALAIMRALRNISAPPFAVTLDSFPGYFQVPTMFRVNKTRDCPMYILDCAFSVGVVGTLVVFVWRGVWVMFDRYFYPDNREYSVLGSLAIGYGIAVVAFCLQPLMKWICSRIEGVARLIVADVFLLMSFLSTVNVWRGMWGALDLWFIPENPKLSCWITHIGCFIFLVLLNCSNTILVRGVYIDAEENSGDCVIFPCQYLRIFYKSERAKREAQRHLSTIMEYKENGGLASSNGKTSSLPLLPRNQEPPV